MRRREFITLLGGAAATWPLAAQAQQPGERMRRIGVVSSLREDDPEWAARRAVFEQALQALGWTIGRDLRIGRGPRCNSRYIRTCCGMAAAMP
jgi:putative ABC transport system substrate-binding protein